MIRDFEFKKEFLERVMTKQYIISSVRQLLKIENSVHKNDQGSQLLLRKYKEGLDNYSIEDLELALTRSNRLEPEVINYINKEINRRNQNKNQHLK